MNKRTEILWLACLLIEEAPLPDGIGDTSYERLPGAFATSSEAMDFAEEAMRLRPDAVGISAVRVEVPRGA